jgi:hypothetical protein
MHPRPPTTKWICSTMMNPPLIKDGSPSPINMGINIQPWEEKSGLAVTSMAAGTVMDSDCDSLINVGTLRTEYPYI